MCTRKTTWVLRALTTLKFRAAGTFVYWVTGKVGGAHAPRDIDIENRENVGLAREVQNEIQNYGKYAKLSRRAQHVNVLCAGEARKTTDPEKKAQRLFIFFVRRF